MQEEVENKTLTLVISGSKFTGRMLKTAISKYLAHRKEVKVEKRAGTVPWSPTANRRCNSSSARIRACPTCFTSAV